MLSDAKVKNLKASTSRQRIADMNGLYIEVMPSGKKNWLYRYTKDGTRNWSALGEYPLISLKEARILAEQFKAKLQGLILEELPAVSFAAVWDEWLIKKVEPALSPKYIKDIKSRSNSHILPFVGAQPISELSSADILKVLRRLEARGNIHMAHTICQISAVFSVMGLRRGIAITIPRRHCAELCRHTR